MIWIVYFAFFLAIGLRSLTHSFGTSFTGSQRNHLLAGFKNSFSKPLHASSDTIDTPIVPIDITLSESLKKGVVLLAQPSEENDFYSKAAILIFNCGNDQGSAGVILERETGVSFITKYIISMLYFSVIIMNKTLLSLCLLIVTIITGSI